MLPKHEQAIRSGIGQRADERRVDEIEDGAGRADAGGKHQHREQRESGRLAQRAERVADVAGQRRHDH